MTVFEYRVDSSQVVGIQAFQNLLNQAGQDRWDLVSADDSGIVIYKRSSLSQISTYLVSQPPGTTTLETYLTDQGVLGWELVIVNAVQNQVIFKKEA